MGIDEAIGLLEESLERLTKLEDPKEVESRYKETLYTLQKTHIARKLKSKDAISLLINLYNGGKAYS